MDLRFGIVPHLPLLVIIAACCSADHNATTRDARGLSVVSPASMVSSSGLITSWGTMMTRSLGKVYLEVWRPLTHLHAPVGDVMLHELVARTPNRDSRMYSEGQKEFTLQDKEYIRVETGDLIGLHYSDVTTISNEFTFNSNGTACFNKNIFYEAEWLEALLYPTYRRFTKVTGHISQCGMHLPMYVLQDDSCRIVNAEANERRIHLSNGFGQPCWIFQGCGGCELSLTFDTCDVLDLITVHNGHSSSAEPLPIVCNTATNQASCRSRHTNYVYIAYCPDNVDKPKVGLSFKSHHKGDDCIHLYADTQGITMEFNNSVTGDCWRVTETQQQKRLVIEFSKLSPAYNISAYDVQCPSDVFELRDGILASSPQLYLPCSDDHRHTSSVISSSSYLRIMARGLHSHAFQVRIRSATKDIQRCTVYNVDLYQPTILTSAGYPQNYQPSTSVCWLLRSMSRNYRLLLTVLDSDLEHHVHCASDFVEVKDGGDSDSPTMVTWCGPQLPASLLSTSGSLYIRFVTDHNVSYRGFKLSVNLIKTDLCTVRLAHPRDQLLFRSASLTRSNVNSTFCWVIENRIPVHHIRIEIQGLFSTQCGFLDVREGKTSTSPSLFATNGTSSKHPSHEVHGSGRYMYISYTSCGLSSNLSVSYQSVGMSESVMVTSRTKPMTSTSPNGNIPIHKKLAPIVSLGGPRVSESLQPTEKIRSGFHLAPIIAIPVAMITIIAILIIILVVVHKRRKVGLTTVPIFDRTHPCRELPMAAASPKTTRLGGNDVIRCVCTGSHVAGSAQPVGTGSDFAMASGSGEVAEDCGYAELEDVMGEVRGCYTNYLYETLHKTGVHEKRDSSEATC